MSNRNNEIYINLPKEIIYKINEYIPRDKNMKSPTSDCILQMVSDFESQWDGQLKWSLQSFFGEKEELKRLRREELERLEQEDNYFSESEEFEIEESESEE